MRPAFSSTKAAAGFVFLVATILLLPALFGKNSLPPRERAYANAAWHLGAFPWIHRQIFQEKSDVDIAFVGSSIIFSGINTPAVQKELAQKLGRPAVVLTLGWFWAGFDADFFVAQDLLQHRRVRMLVIYDEDTRADSPHPLAPVWFRWGNNAGDVAAQPSGFKAGLYTSAVMGMPRNLLSQARPDLGMNPKLENFWAKNYFAPSPAEELGTIISRRPFINGSNFFTWQPGSDAAAAEVCVYSAATSNRFEFTGPPTRPYQLAFVRALAALAQSHGTKLVILHFPPSTKTGANVITERENWPAVLTNQCALMGIPPARLFAGMTDGEIARLYYGDDHFNQNGQAYFTRLITPALLQLYDTPADHR